VNREESDYIKQAIEAILFFSPKSILISKIYKTLGNVSKEIVDLQISELINDYNKRKTAISIVKYNNKLEMVVKPEFQSFGTFITGTKLTPGELKTLAYISLNSPVEQAKITKKRPFAHLQVLKDFDLIKVTKNGHKNVLSTTQKFKFLFKNKK